MILRTVLHITCNVYCSHKAGTSFFCPKIRYTMSSCQFAAVKELCRNTLPRSRWVNHIATTVQAWTLVFHYASRGHMCSVYIYIYILCTHTHHFLLQKWWNVASVLIVASSLYIRKRLICTDLVNQFSETPQYVGNFGNWKHPWLGQNFRWPRNFLRNEYGSNCSSVLQVSG